MWWTPNGFAGSRSTGVIRGRLVRLREAVSNQPLRQERNRCGGPGAAPRPPGAPVAARRAGGSKGGAASLASPIVYTMGMLALVHKHVSQPQGWGPSWDLDRADAPHREAGGSTRHLTDPELTNRPRDRPVKQRAGPRRGGMPAPSRWRTLSARGAPRARLWTLVAGGPRSLRVGLTPRRTPPKRPSPAFARRTDRSADKRLRRPGPYGPAPPPPASARSPARRSSR